jgi:HD-GYP domain-containing protein (c-di-GMP phosphodiesterase class II)
MPDAQSGLIAAAGLLHDVGKIGIPDSILTKPGPLTGTERRIVQCHTTIGHALLAGSCHPVLKAAAEIALHHHERLDGSGYPHGLRGTAIPLEARMVAIADTFDALTSERPYRVARPAEDALAVIHASAGELFDAELVDAFTTVIAGGSDVGQRDVQGTWHAVELERVDQQPRVAHLAAAAAAHEPAELLLQRPAPPGGLLLQRAERHQIALDG